MKENEIKTITHKRNRKTAIFFIALLSTLLVASVVLGITGAYFSNTATSTGTVTLGDPVQISITQGGASAAALTFSGSALPGDVYDQPIGIAVPANSSDCVVRAKLTITIPDGSVSVVNATTDANWVQGEDDYYYYNGVMSAADTANFVTSVTIPTELTNTAANKVNTIEVVVEALQHANAAAAAVWTTAPTAWTEAYGNG